MLDGSDVADCQNAILTFNSSITVIVLELFGYAKLLSDQQFLLWCMEVAQPDLKQ